MSVFNSMRNFLHTNNLSKCHSLFSLTKFHTSQVAHLFSPASIGVDQYSQTRHRVGAQFGSLKEKFIKKMEDFVEDSPKNMIFSEDLKNMVHIAEKEDLSLACRMIRKFNSQSAEYRFGSFVFGPVVMRMFHYLNAPDEALQCYNEAKSTTFFDQLVSHQVLMDLLYRNSRYDDVLSVFQHLSDKQINMIKFPKYPVCLVMAACYKQNTSQSLEYASKLVTEMNAVGSELLRKAATFVAGLALNQGAPHVAMEVVSSQRPHYITVRNIKAIALAEMGRVDDALPILRSVLDIDKPSQKDKHTFLRETVEKVKQAVVESKNKDLLHEFNIIEKALTERNLIDEETLDGILTKEIQPPNQMQTTSQAMLHASYQDYRRPPRRAAPHGDTY